VGAGTGLIYLLRWFWWRINAWSEIAAMVSSFLLAAGLFVAPRFGIVIPTHISLLATIAITTILWLVTAYVTEPTDRATLREFYMRARPAGPGWAPVRAECPGVTPADNLSAAFICWFAGLALVYGALFGAGHLLFGHMAAGTIGAVCAIAGAIVLLRTLPRLWRA
jgi:hypothetical protein